MSVIVEKLEDINCTTCLNSKQWIGDGLRQCFWPCDAEQRQEVNETDWCSERGAWLVRYRHVDGSESATYPVSHTEAILKFL